MVMNNTQSAILYYSAVSVLSLIFILMFLSWLSWPFLASAVLGGALFIHLVNLSRHAKIYMEKSKESSESDEAADGIRNAFGSSENSSSH